MIVKPTPAPADPTKVCRTCGLYDPDVHVCCAHDVVVSDDVAKTKRCGDWEPNHICITCGRFDPATKGCWWFGEQNMSEESMMKPCGSWEPKKEKLNVFTVNETIGMDPVNPVKVPLQPDGSLKMQAKEIIGAETVNTDAVVRLQKLCDEAEPCKAKVTFQYKESGEEHWDHQLEAKTLDRGAKQGMTLEALDTVFAIACQQVPSMEKRWMELKGEINVMFAKKWAAEDMPK